MAVNACLKDKKQRMKLVVSVYGVMDMSVAEDTPYNWDYSLYQMEEEQKDYIMNRLFRFKELNDSMNELYLQNGESTLDGEISPLFSEHLDCLPKVLMIEAEFDYFRVCNQEFEKRMQEAMLSIKKKFGKNAVLKGMNLQEGATARDRNEQIGGHKA